ncbi:MAG: hypothetical protein J7501_10785 [Bdellovibrio sp.]|nr:hypothetical protein [Bdellovibrio sp.]
MKFKPSALCSFVVVLTMLSTSHAYEIDSFYKRHQSIKDSGDLANAEINKKIATAVSLTKSCDVKELYTNVRNQINADSAGAGVIGGMERWAEKSTDVDKISPPPADQSIYEGTSFESVTSMGFWLNLYGLVKDKVNSGVLKTKLAIRKLTTASSDPLVLCKVSDSEKELAGKFVEFSKRKPGSGGPPPGGGNPPPEGEPQSGPDGGPPGDFGGMKKTMEFGSTETGTCISEVLGLKNSKSTASLQPVINLNGVRVGADKLGHFFDQGFDYFQKEYSIQNNKLIAQEDGQKKALEYGTSTEEGMFGLKGTGVKSYGDLAANYDGSRFWYNLTSGESPLVICKNGKMEVSHSFDVKDYVTEAWDEGTNCSEYKTQEMKEHVAQNLKNLKLSCPVEVAKCQAIEKHYSAEVLNSIVSPECKKNFTADRSGAHTQGGTK